MGSALCIELPAGLKSGQYIDVKVSYTTTKDSTALQWLDKEYIVLFWYIFSCLDSGLYPDRPKEKSSLIYSASASRSTLVLLLHYKVRSQDSNYL